MDFAECGLRCRWWCRWSEDDDAVFSWTFSKRRSLKLCSWWLVAFLASQFQELVRDWSPRLVLLRIVVLRANADLANSSVAVTLLP